MDREEVLSYKSHQQQLLTAVPHALLASHTLLKTYNNFVDACNAPSRNSLKVHCQRLWANVRTCIDSTTCLGDIVVVEVVVVDVGVGHTQHEDATTCRSGVADKARVFNCQAGAIGHVDGAPLGACTTIHTLVDGFCAYIKS